MFPPTSYRLGTGLTDRQTERERDRHGKRDRINDRFSITLIGVHGEYAVFGLF